MRKSSVGPRPELTKLRTEFAIYNIKDLEVVKTQEKQGEEVNALNTRPSQGTSSHKTSDGHKDAEDSLNLDSDNDSDDHEDLCALPTRRDARVESASPEDYNEFETTVLQTEDDANDKAMRDIVTDDHCYTFNWTTEKAAFTGRRETFTEPCGPTFDVTDMTPLDIFDKIIDRDFIDRLCTETNRYADQKIKQLMAQKENLHKSRLHDWTPTDHDEMITFIATLILQGLFYRHDDEEYFTCEGLGAMPYFSRIMGYDRFCLLKKMYHFVDNTKLKNMTRLAKIQPVVDYFNEKFPQLYKPAQDIVIDESLLKWHGRLNFEQKIATKEAHLAIKTYELCEAKSGYLWKFFVDSGKRDKLTRRDDDAATCTDRPTNPTVKIVFDLLGPLLDRAHTVIIDNFYNTPLLLRCLKRRKTDCFGTLRLSREFVPESLKTLEETDLKRGEVVTWYTSDLSLMAWQVGRLGSLISTYHQQQSGVLQGYNKPTVVLDYNKSMVEVDKKDRILAEQTADRVRVNVWYKEAFCRLLSTAIFNGFVIFKTKDPNMSFVTFRTIMAEDLLKRHRNMDLKREARLYTTDTGEMSARTNKRPKVDGNHFPEKSSEVMPRCVVCLAKNKISTTDVYQCMECKVPLCIDECFRNYHKQRPDMA